MKLLTPVSPTARITLGISFFVLFIAVWSIATFGGFVSKTFLADPVMMVKSGYTLLTEMDFAKDIGMTVWRVLGGFLLAAALALPLGVMMGAYKPIEAFFEPFVSFARYLPASAFIPLLILWAGIGDDGAICRCCRRNRQQSDRRCASDSCHRFAENVAQWRHRQ